MPTGRGRRPAPAGYITAAKAGELLGQSRLYKLVEAGRLHRHTPPGQKHGYYSESEVQVILDADRAFFEEKLHKISAHFVQTKPSDIKSLRELAVRMFGEITISEEIRRAWVEKEPRGNYVIKRDDTSEVIAYFYVQSLSHERIMRYMQECRGSTITVDDIRKIEPGQHELIVAGIGRDQRADKQYMAVMLHGFAQDMVNWAREGIEITRLYAYSETMDGIFLCFKMGMELIETPRMIRGQPHYKFMLDIQKSTHPLISPYKRALAEYKKSHEQPTTAPVSIRVPRAKAPKPPSTSTSEKTFLPAGWYAWTPFIDRHSVSSERRSIMALDRSRYCQTGEYHQPIAGQSGTVRVKCALDPTGQANLLTQLWSMNLRSELRQCGVEDCPCHEIIKAS